MKKKLFFQKRTIFLFSVLILLTQPIYPQEDKHKTSETVSDSTNESKKPKKNILGGFITFDASYDTRDRTMLTERALVKMPAGFEYFGFVNFFTPIDKSKNFEFYYTEQNLYWKLPKKIPLGLNIQLVSTTGADNDLTRFAMGWEPSSTPGLDKLFKKIHMWYRIYFHVLQTDFNPSPGWGWQIEHAYRIDIFPKALHDRVYIYGFTDHDMNYGADKGSDNTSWVFEHQLNVRLINWLYAMIQVRHEEFLPKQTGFGAGLQYEFHF